MAILGTIPFKPKAIATSITNKGASINLYNKATLICLISLAQPPNFNCSPIENKANGPTVAAILSKNKDKGDKSIKCGKVKAKTKPHIGGKVNTFLNNKPASNF